jgi:hypothetical protein
MNMPGWTPCFYRTAVGSEIDLIMIRGNQKIAFECKASTAPKLTKGWWDAIDDINPDKTYVVAPIDSSAYPLSDSVTITSLIECINLVKMLA